MTQRPVALLAQAQPAPAPQVQTPVPPPVVPGRRHAAADDRHASDAAQAPLR